MRKYLEVALALREVLYVLAILLALGLVVFLVRGHDRARLAPDAVEAAKAQGYEAVAFERVVRVGRSWAVACGSADGHRAVYATDKVLRVEDHDPLAASRYEFYCSR